MGEATWRKEQGRGRRGDRPPALKPRDIKEARALLADPEITVEEIMARLKVAPSTLYRHLPGERGAIQDAAGAGK